MSDIFDYTERNRDAWNEIAQIRQATQQPAAFFAQGHSTLDPRERQAAGNVSGKRLLHLQCATGEDTLSWVIAGADATGVDISEQQIALAEQKAAEAGISARFVAADIYALPPDLQAATFDLVYTGKGVLVWLPDLARWGQIVAAALRPGGCLVLFEEHPVAGCLWMSDGMLHLEDDYFGRNKAIESQGWRHFKGGEQATARKAEFVWPLGDVVTALAQAGLRIERLEEFPAGTGWRFGEKGNDLFRLPGQFVLTARKE